MLRQHIQVVAASAVMVGLVLAPTGVHADPIDGAILPPWGLAAAQGPSGVELSWNAPIDGAGTYRIYRTDSWEAVMQHGSDAFEVIAETASLSFIDEGGLGMEGAVYAVTSVQGSNESAPSNPVMPQYPHCWNVTTLEDCFIP